MQCLKVNVLFIELLYFTQNIFCFQLDNGQLNRILDYLQQEAHEKNRHNFGSKNILSDLQSIVSGGRNGYQTSQHSREDGDNTSLNAFGEDELYHEAKNDALLKILSQKAQGVNIPKVRANKNRLISKQDDSDNNAEYSKVYLVLNPRVKVNKADLKGISEIVSQLVLPKQKPTNQKQRRYKGFAVMDDFLTRRRRDRDSGEKFTLTKDTIERDYKPKRSRNDYSGGTGRTAIPYIRHRGDIYERP